MPRSLRMLGLPLVAVLLIGFFVYWRFPYDRANTYLTAELSRATGVEIAVAELGPALALAGPGLEARGVHAKLANGDALRFERGQVRPAWALSWLRGQPALHTELEGALGGARGTLTLDGARAWSGDLRDVDLARLPASALWPGVVLAGLAQATLDLRLGEAGPEGPVAFEARDGSLKLEALPTPVPFERLSGALAFGGDVFVALESLELEGPLLTASATGSLGRGPLLADAPLRLSITLSAKPAVREVLRAAGLRLTRTGVAKFRVTGTPSRPIVR